MIAAGVLAGRPVELLDGQIIDRAPELPIHRATYRRGAKYLETLLGDRAVVFSAATVEALTVGSIYPLSFPDIAVAIERFWG